MSSSVDRRQRTYRVYPFYNPARGCAAGDLLLSFLSGGPTVLSGNTHPIPTIIPRQMFGRRLGHRIKTP